MQNYRGGFVAEQHLRLFRENFCFYSYLCSFSWSNKRHIKLYLVKILLHKTECSAYALLCFFSMFLIRSVHSPSCSGEHEPGAFARLREMWCGDGTVKGKIKKHFEIEFGWFRVFLVEISSPLDGSSQSYMHQDGKTLPWIICCEEVDVRNIFMRGLLGFFCCVACKRNYIFCIFSSLGKYIHTQALLPNLSNLYSCKKET